MEAVLHNVAALDDYPVAWIVAALIAVKALIAVYFSLRCPIMRGTAEITPEVIAEAKAFRAGVTPAYVIIMVLGIALAIGGLYMMQDSVHGPLALSALALGMFLFLSEPPRILANMAVQAVFATSDGDAEVNALARDRLRSALLRRAGYEICIAAIVVAFVFPV